jgi:hypothetical protein
LGVFETGGQALVDVEMGFWDFEGQFADERAAGKFAGD